MKQSQINTECSVENFEIFVYTDFCALSGLNQLWSSNVHRERQKLTLRDVCIIIFMWMPLKFRPFLISGILHSCQYALHQLHDMEGKKRKEWKNLSGEIFIHTYRKI